MKAKDFLDEVIWDIPFTADKTVPFTVRNAVEGIQIFGGIGSGKTSGSGRTLYKKMLLKGFGGLVLTAKVDEKDAWIRYCKEANRLDDLIIIEPRGEHRFNFLDFITESTEKGEVFTDSIVEVLKTVINSNSQEKVSSDPFWENSLNMLLKNVINLCRIANGKVTVQLLYDIVSSIPKPYYTEDENSRKLTQPFYLAYKKALNSVKAQIDEMEAYHSRTQNGRKIVLSEDEINEIEDARIFSQLDNFFFESLKNLSDKTKSIVIFSFKSFLFDLLQEPTYSLFCKSKSTITPLECLKGKIILLNIPVKKFHQVGRSCQVLFKYIWQREMEKREINAASKAVFLIADEAQHFIHEKDAEFQATARGSRICTLYITQNIPNYRARMGGTKADDLVAGFLGTLSNKIFHANSCSATNRYASDLIGQVYYEKITETTTLGSDNNFSKTRTTSLELKSIIRPEEFSSLATGGTERGIVSSVLHCQGYSKFGNKNYAKVIFEQNN